MVGAVYLIRENWNSIVRYFTEGRGTGFLNAVVNAFNQFADLIVAIVGFIAKGWRFSGRTSPASGRRRWTVWSSCSSAVEAVATLFGTFAALFRGDWRGFFTGTVDTALTILQFLVERFVLVFGTIGGIITASPRRWASRARASRTSSSLGTSLVEGLEDEI